MHWEEALEVLAERGWDRTRLVDDVLALLASRHFRWGMPTSLIQLAVRHDVDARTADALTSVARTWLLGEEDTRIELLDRVRELRSRRAGDRMPRRAERGSS